MNPFVFEEENTDFETMIRGKTIPAAQFLTNVEPYTDEEMMDLFESHYRSGGTIDITDLVFVQSGKQKEKRLALEKSIMDGKKTIRELDANDPLRLFLQENTHHKKTTQELLQTAVRSGNWDKVTEMYLPVVLELAKEHVGKGVLMMDLIQEGSLGLWETLSGWQDGDLDLLLRAGIQKSLVRAILVQAKEDGVGSLLKSHMEAYKKTDMQLLNRLGRNPTSAEIAQEMAVSEELVASVEKMIKDANTSKEPAVEEEKDQEEDLEVDATAYYQSRQRVLDLLSGLNEIDAKIISLRFGLETGKALSAEETAEILGMTATEVTEHEMNAMKSLRSVEE